jgi:hypothetical protein
MSAIAPPQLLMLLITLKSDQKGYVGSTQAVSKLLLRRNMLSLRKPEPDSAQHSERACRAQQLLLML